MDEASELIADLMNSLADARVTLELCLSALAKTDKPTRQEIAEALREQIADRLREIGVVRLKVLAHITAEEDEPE